MENSDPPNHLIEQIKGLEPLIVTNERHTFIRQDGGRGRANFLPDAYLQNCLLAVLDMETTRLIQVLQLHKAIRSS